MVPEYAAGNGLATGGAPARSGRERAELIKGWYDLAGAAGFLLVETGDLRELTAMLRPYMDLMAWDIRALSENRYDETIQQIRDALAQMPEGE
ncbi:MAG: DUF3303 family protein [Thermomicrobiales bacterium]